MLDKGAIIALLDTNPNETAGFLKDYVSWQNGIVLALLLSSIIFFTWKIKAFNNTKSLEILRQISFVVLIFALYRGVYHFPANKYQLSSYNVYSLYKSAKDDIEQLDMINRRKFSKFDNITSVFEGKKQTFVIVIGESSSRRHFSLYGYHQNTNPFLEKIKDELFLFDNVVSSHPQTLTSLQKALSFAEFENMDALYDKGSIINFFNDAGFKTFWFSNQFAGGAHDSYTAIIASDTSRVMFSKEVNQYVGKRAYDGDLVGLLKEALDDSADKKVIFLHLSGEHSVYSDTYPSEFNVFKYSNKEQRIANYDNAIRYRDFVMSDLIETIKAGAGGIGYLVYMPDHSEDADEIDSCFCHSSAIAKDNMFEIPFIVWLSPEYKEARKEFSDGLKGYLGRGFNTQHFIHSVMDLSGLYNADITLSKSLFSKTYEKPDVLIRK
jgi:heptose-I-phosphate ethanolaminephosphotransferase